MASLVYRICTLSSVRRSSYLIPSLSSSFRHYSSSSSSNAKLSAMDGSEGVLQFFNRAKDRAATQMTRYVEHNVFPPSNWMLKNFFLFTKLQLPTNTEIDAIEFLNGARFACDLAVNTMYSREFVNFATGAISESPAAEKMKLGLSAACYEAFLSAMKETSMMDNRFTLKQLDINGAYLYDVIWDRMSLATLKQEEALEAYNRAQVATLEQAEEDTTVEEGKTSAVKGARTVVERLTADITPADHTTMVERLQLDVLLETVEHLEIATSEGADQILDKRSSAVWRFESLVTQPEDVDWRIVTVF